VPFAAEAATTKRGDERLGPASVYSAPTAHPFRLDGYQWLLLAAILAYVVIFSALAFQFHAAMRTNKADLGQIAQSVWNSSRGHFLEQTDNGYVATRLTDHVEPILVLISPLLWLWEDVRALMMLQAAAVAAGAWLLYHLALRRLARVLAPQEQDQVWRREPLLALARPMALALAVAWLLAPQLQTALLTEFHAAPLAAPLVLWALWSVEARRLRHFVAAVLLVALVKEEMALLAALLGLWGAWQGWRQRVEARKQSAETTGTRAFILWGLALAAASLAWFATATFVIVPRYAADVYGVAESGYFARYGALGDSPLDIVRSLITQPRVVWQILTERARLLYLWDLVAAFALLPLLGPELLLLSLPLLMANVLSAYPAQYYGEFHYSAPLMPYVAAAAAFGLGRIWGWLWRRTEGASPAYQHAPAANAAVMAAATFARNPRTAVRPLAAGLLVIWILAWAAGAYLQAGRAWGGGRWDPLTVTPHNRLLKEFIAQIPRDAPLTATAALHPHASLRRYIYQFPQGLDAPVPATWALLDVTANTDMAPGDVKQAVDALLASGWGVVDGRDGYLLLQQGGGSATIPDAFYSFTRLPERAGTESEEVAVNVNDWARWRQSQLVATWQPFDATWGAPRLELISPAGELLYTPATLTPPSLLWLPEADWHSGESMRVTTLPLSLPRSALLRAGGSAPDAPEAAIVLRRTQGDALRTLPFTALEKNDYAQALSGLTDFRLNAAHALFEAPDGPLDLAAWSEARTTWPGDGVELWLQWQGDAWPTGYIPFVHLRRINETSSETLAQQDGMPRLFAPPDTEATAQALATRGFANDWRTLQLPANALPAGDWEIAVGLYNPESGARLSLASGGDAFTAARLSVAPAVADQTCALIPDTCAAQPAPR
jgi:uncharacterized membrane protein